MAAALGLTAFSNVSPQELAAGHARGSFHLALEAATVTEPPSAWADAMSAIAIVQAATGDIVAAKATAELVGVADAKVRALAAIGLAHTAGDLTAAKAIFARAKATAETIPAESRAGALIAIATAQAQASDVTGAKATAGTILIASGRATALTAIAVAQARCGDQSGAKATIRMISDPAGRLRALSAIAAAQAKAGDLPDAKATLGLIADYAVKADGLSATAVALAKQGDIAGANATEEKIPAGIAKIEAVLAIGMAHARNRDWAAARLIFNQAREQIDSLTDMKGSALAALARAQFMAGDFDRAKAALAANPSGLIKGEALSGIAAAYAWKLGLQDAEAWAKSLREPADRCHAHLGVARAAVARSRVLASLDEDED